MINKQLVKNKKQKSIIGKKKIRDEEEKCNKKQKMIKNIKLCSNYVS